jgi:hypothetical protein
MTQAASPSFKIPTTSPQPSSGTAARRARRASAVRPAPGRVLTSGTGRAATRGGPCYRDVFGDFEDFTAWRSDMFDRHVARDGYRLAVAVDGHTVVGFSWGYVGEHGQYWTDLVCQALPAIVTDSDGPESC